MRSYIKMFSNDLICICGLWKLSPADAWVTPQGSTRPDLDQRVRDWTFLRLIDQTKTKTINVSMSRQDQDCIQKILIPRLYRDTCWCLLPPPPTHTLCSGKLVGDTLNKICHLRPTWTQNYLIWYSNSKIRSNEIDSLKLRNLRELIFWMYPYF